VLSLPYKAGAAIPVTARIIRVARREDGKFVAALRFTSISTEDEQRLEQILDMLLGGSGGGRREHARLVQRLDLHFDDPEDVKATLEDVSKGGLKATVPKAFEEGQSVKLTISGVWGLKSLVLRAKVVNQDKLEENGVEFYRVGLEFEHPTREVQQKVDNALKRLARSRKPVPRPGDSSTGASAR